MPNNKNSIMITMTFDKLSCLPMWLFIFVETCTQIIRGKWYPCFLMLDNVIFWVLKPGYLLTHFWFYTCLHLDTFTLVEMRMHGPRENTTMLYLGPPTTHYVSPRKQVKIPGIPDHTDNSTVDFMYVPYIRDFP